MLTTKLLLSLLLLVLLPLMRDQEREVIIEDAQPGTTPTESFG